MALVVADRVQQTTTTAGTGTVTLSGSVTGYQSFSAIGNGNTTYYTLVDGSNWEVGIGTYTASGTTLSRDTVYASSAGGTTKITLSGGTTNVFVTYPAEIATMLTNPTPTNGGVVYGTGTAIGVSAAGTVSGYQFLQSAGAASPTWVQIPSFKDVAVAPSSPAPIEGDRFFDNTSGINYTYITDANGSQWVETSAAGTPTNGVFSTMALGGATLGSNALAVTGTAAISGATTAGTLALGGATIGSNALAVTGTSQFNGSVTTTGRITQSLSPVSGEYALYSTGQTTGYIIFQMNNTGGSYMVAGENSTGGALIAGDSAYDMAIRGPSGISFSANAGATQHMRLNTSGDLTITRQFIGSNFRGSFNGNTYNGVDVNDTVDASSAWFFLARNSSGTVLGGIQRNGTANSLIFQTSSDYRLKEKVYEITGAIDRVKNMRPVGFDWIGTDGQHDEGFLAHELQEYVPFAVTGEKDALDDAGRPKYQSVDYSKVVPLLTAALKEALDEIETLKATVADLVARLEALENK